MRVHVTLLTVRTIEQGVAIEFGKFSDEYTKSVGICELDREDLNVLGAKEGDTVKVVTEYGKVCVRAVAADGKSHPGVAIMPLGIWANSVINGDTESIGMPRFKGIPAEIILLKNQKVLNAKELIRASYK